MGAMTPLSNRDCVALLKQWGFVEAGTKGGHAVLEFNGRRVQVTAPGRATKTPYKALRKAARILGISLKELLEGNQPVKASKPAQVQLEDIPTEPTTRSSLLPLEPATEPKEEAVVASTVYACTVCGKSDFKTERGFKGHLRSHEESQCGKCGKKMSLQGLGSHVARCRPKRKVGRPRHPIAEPVETKRRGKAPKDLGVEVPEILDSEDFNFPDPQDFAPRIPEPVEQTEKVEDSVFRTVEDVLHDYDERIALDQYELDRISLLLSIFFPGKTLTEEQTDDFLDWIEATKALFDSL